MDDVHGHDGLAASMLGVYDSVSDEICEEDLEHTTDLLVDETRDALDAATTSETADGGLGDATNTVTENLAVALGASLSESLASFTTSRHLDSSADLLRMMAKLAKTRYIWPSRGCILK